MPSTKPSSGTKANRTGNVLEQTVESLLKQHGYTEFANHKRQVFDARNTIGGKQYAKHVYVGKTIYESDRIVDFLVINPELFPDSLIIECKWQQATGSVDEKYPFLAANIAKTAVPTIVLLDGSGYKKTAEAWLRSQVGGGIIRGVFTLQEFIRAVNNGLLG